MENTNNKISPAELYPLEYLAFTMGKNSLSHSRNPKKIENFRNSSRKQIENLCQQIPYLPKPPRHCVNPLEEIKLQEAWWDGYEAKAAQDEKPIHLTEDQTHLLNWYNEHYPDICTLTRYRNRSDKKNRENATTLEHHGLVEKKGSKGERVITQKGREYIEKYF